MNLHFCKAINNYANLKKIKELDLQLLLLSQLRAGIPVCVPEILPIPSTL